MTKTQTAESLVASDILERVLAKGRSTGAEFAEVYIEDKRSTSAGLDDGKVEQVTSGRDRVRAFVSWLARRLVSLIRLISQSVDY